MREKYFISSRPRTDGTYLIHKEGCPFLPGCDRQIFLGAYKSVKGALEEGQKYYKTASACRFCLKEHCHDTGFRMFPITISGAGSGSSLRMNDPGHVSALVCCKN
ncbi:MAG TPA: hypothetical protein PKX27_12780 [Bacteroidales bacterium]|nr:hypothetical protein [Bacteroidales bacterium]HPM88855.1 hypothetical protein [Bacteroidales bacterium]HQM70957.1 hypothetical protein [Bacteroidales bacterium]